MEEREESKISWISCPECGAKIGVVISLGKAIQTIEKPPAPSEPASTWPPSDLSDRLSAQGIDPGLINVEEREDVIILTPKKFLGDLWGPINDAIRGLGGIWIREGRQSRWEISKQESG